MANTLSAFLAQNALVPENIRYAVSERFVDAEGKPMEWEIKTISSARDEDLRKACTRRVPVPGKKNMFQNEVDNNLYLGKLAVACTVFPDLANAELQDSYHVKGEDELLKTMLLPGEYADYLVKIQEICGFDVTLQDEVDESKNS